MTKKHFIRLAEAIKGIKDKAERGRIASIIGVICANINNRFDFAKWNAYING